MWRLKSERSVAPIGRRSRWWLQSALAASVLGACTSGGSERVTGVPADPASADGAATQGEPASASNPPTDTEVLTSDGTPAASLGSSADASWGGDVSIPDADSSTGEHSTTSESSVSRSTTAARAPDTRSAVPAQSSDLDAGALTTTAAPSADSTIASGAVDESAPSSNVTQNQDAGWLDPGSFQAAALEGFFDVDYEPTSLATGCRLPDYYAAGHLNLAVRWVNNELQSRLAPDFRRENFRPVDSTTTTRLVTQPYDSSFPTYLEADLGADGFAQTGILITQAYCEEQKTDITVELPVRIGPDVTAPVVRPAWRDFPLGVVLSADYTRVVVSEPVTGLPEQASGPGDAETAATLVSLRDVESTTSVAHVWERPPLWESVGFRFTDRASVEGRLLELVLTGDTADEAGNPLRVGEPFVVQPSGPTTPSFDFGVAPPGLGRGAEHIPAGQPESPCETGGCVVLEGWSWEKSGKTTSAPDNSSNPYLAVVLPADPTLYAKVRTRYFVKGDDVAGVSGDLAWSEQGSMAVSGGSPGLQEVAWREYTHATPWQTRFLNTMGKAAEKGYVFSLPPHLLGQAPVQLALVIDSIEAVSCIEPCP